MDAQKDLTVSGMKLMTRYNALKLERDKRLGLWCDIQRFVSPWLGKFTNTLPNEPVTGWEELLDTTAVKCLNILQSGLQGGLTSPSRSWFQLVVSNSEDGNDIDVMEWLNDVREVMTQILAQSNIYNRLHTLYGEIAAYGTAALYIDDDGDHVINAKLIPCGEFVCSFDSAGLSNCFGRELYMTVSDMVEVFGLEHISQSARSQLDNGNESAWFKVYHMIFRDKSWGMPKQVTRFPFASVYWEEGQDIPALIGGYEEFPVMIPRWGANGNDWWGQGLGETILPESKTLQVMRSNHLYAEEMEIKPPLAIPQGAVADGVNIYPGAIQYISDPNHRYGPLITVKPDIAGHMLAMTESRNIINQGMFADLFLMMSGVAAGKMTATEVAIRQQERMQILGPVIERLEYELLNPLVTRSYMLCLRRGLIPDPPEVLQGKEVKIEYISMLALAQKASSMDNINQLLALVGGLSGMNPEVIDKIDGDEIIDQYVRLSAIPAEVIKKPEDVEQIRKDRAQQMQAAQQAQMEQSQAATVLQGAQAMKAGAEAGLSMQEGAQPPLLGNGGVL